MDLEQKAPTDLCNGIDRKTQSYCTKKAGWGTQHPGYGRCRKHGGNSEKIKLPAPGTIKELVAQRKKDLDVFDLKEELSISRAIVEYLNNEMAFAEDKDEQLVIMKTINMFLQTSTKVAKEMFDIESKRKGMISINEVKKIMDDFVSIILDEVPDPSLQDQIMDRILKLSIDGAITVPPDDAKHADAWALENTQSSVKKDKADSIIEAFSTELNEVIEIPEMESERVSLAAFPERLKTTLPKSAPPSPDPENLDF